MGKKIKYFTQRDSDSKGHKEKKLFHKIPLRSLHEIVSHKETAITKGTKKKVVS